MKFVTLAGPVSRYGVTLAEQRAAVQVALLGLTQS